MSAVPPHNQKCTDNQFIAAFKRGGAAEVSETYGIAVRMVYVRRRSIEKARGIVIPSPGAAPVGTGVARGKEAKKRDLPAEVAKLLLAGPRTVQAIAIALSITEGNALDAVRTLQASHSVMERGTHYSIEKTPLPLDPSSDLFKFKSTKAGEYRFGVVTDNHLCSKYAREDVLSDLYDWFAREGVTRVYNAGNWIDGEARFNRQDLLVHGMQQQIDYFVEKYPQRPGITTFFVAGDDHEGWYCQREGVDIGKMAQLCAENAKPKRNDLRYLGYMEAWISLEHAKTGKTSQLLVVHPGGGSSYAISYAPQKYVEALQGGEKPAVCIFGHWHKMDCFNYRNVWIIQGGTTEDQTPFMRKRRLEAHVGGLIVDLVQDEKGAITDCKPWMKRYFDRGYYNDQFNPAGPVRRR